MKGGGCLVHCGYTVEGEGKGEALLPGVFSDDAG